ncbi:hypothetical protein Tco_0003540 [Tanacetum coccineum]
MLDPSQGFIDPWGKFGDLELPSVDRSLLALRPHCAEKAHNASSKFVTDQEARFPPMVLSRILFKPTDLILPLAPCLWVIKRW